MINNNSEQGVQAVDNLAVGAKGGAIAFILRISTTILGFLNQIILARMLGAGGIGEVLLAISVVNISAQLAKFGMEAAMMRFVPLYIEKQDNEKLKGTIYFVLKFCLFLSIILVILVLLFSKFIALNIFHSEGLVKFLPIVAMVIPASAIRGLIGGILMGYKDTFKALLPENIVFPLVRIVIFLLLTLRGISTFYAIIAFVAGELLALSLAIVFILKIVNRIDSGKGQCEHKRILKVASTMIFTNIGILIYMQASLWIISYFHSTEAVGIYGVINRLVILVSFSLMAFSTIIPPIISSLHTSGNYEELRKVVRESTRWILSISMPIVLLLVFEGEIILKYLYGEEFVHGYAVLVILSVGHLINSGSGLVGLLLQMTGKHKTFLKIIVFWSLCSVGMSFVLVPLYGIVGAALASSICFSMSSFMSVYIVHKKLSVLTLARGIEFDIAFVAIVAGICFLFRYSGFSLGYHIFLGMSLIFYVLKSIVKEDLPYKLIFAGKMNKPAL